MADAYAKTPRVNSAMLGSYKGQTIRLTAKVVKLNGDNAIVEASDKGQVEIHLNRESHFSTMFIEIIGKVQDDLSIKVLTGIDLGDSIDMDNVEAVNQLINKMKDSEDSVF